jgi:hypothetical protein
MEKREKHKVDGTVRSFEAKHWDYLLKADFKWLSVIIDYESRNNWQ